MSRKIFLAVLGILAITMAFLILRLGIFKSAHLTEEKKGPFGALAKAHVGPYHKINEAISAVESWLKTKDLECHLSFGLYLEDPRVVDHERLHSFGGCLLNQKPSQIPEEFQWQEWPEADYIVGHFEGSPSLSPYKVYPKMEEYFHSRNWKSPSQTLEIYEQTSDRELKTEYLFPRCGEVTQSRCSNNL